MKTKKLNNTLYYFDELWINSDIITNNNLIAVSESNWDYFVFNNTVYYISKESGCDSGIYCNSKKLLGHFKHLRNITAAADLIPAGWETKNAAFFKQLGII